MEKVLVTGACGFIGRELSRKLTAIGCQVRGVDLRRDSSAGIEVWPADITAQNLDPRIFEGMDMVFHLAGKVHSLSAKFNDDDEYFRVNTSGTRRVLEGAGRCGVKRVVFFSTIKAMSNDVVTGRGQGADDRGQRSEDGGQGGGGGRWKMEDGRWKTEDGGRRTEDQQLGIPQDKPLTEEDQIEPDTAYGKSKLEAERLVLQGGYVPEGVVLRLCMVYGPQAKGNIEKMIKAVQHNRFPPLPELGNKRSMVHVQDVVQAAVLAGTHPKATGQVFIVSDGQTYSTRQLYELICRASNRKVPGWTMPIRVLRGLAVVGDLIGKARGRRFVFDSDALKKLTGSAWFSPEKIQTMLGFKPEWNLERALPEMVGGAGDGGDRGRRTEDGGPKTEDRGQRSEVRLKWI
jgi:UDP-glucose 4-epimerase